MNVDIPLFIFSLVDGAALLFLIVYFVITLSDLECDYLNATTCCERLNKWILPEMVAQVILPVLLLITGHWILVLVYGPMGAWVVYKLLTKPSGNIGVYDPAEIHNRNELKFYMREAMVKLGFHMVFFFVFLYNMIVSLIQGSS